MNDEKAKSENANKLAEKKRKRRVMAAQFLILLAVPGLAHAGPIEDAVEWILNLLTNSIARSAAIIFIAVLGYMAWAGRATWERAGGFVVGIVLIFGGATFVDILIGTVSGA